MYKSFGKINKYLWYFLSFFFIEKKTLMLFLLAIKLFFLFDVIFLLFYYFQGRKLMEKFVWLLIVEHTYHTCAKSMSNVNIKVQIYWNLYDTLHSEKSIYIIEPLKSWIIILIIACNTVVSKVINIKISNGIKIN